MEFEIRGDGENIITIVDQTEECAKIFINFTPNFLKRLEKLQKDLNTAKKILNIQDDK